jgi:cell division septation protein DedD
MARAWRRSALAAVAAAILGGACATAVGVQAWAAQDEADEEPAQEQQAAPEEQSPKPGKKRQDPVEAQRAIEAALKQLQAGRPELALQSMTSTLSGGNLPPAIMAKALYVRGMAFRQQRRPAQAISDFNSALWLKGGLGADDRSAAVKERTAAYADAGLGDSGDSDGASTKSASGGGNWLSGIFGGGSSGAASAAPPRPPPAPTPPPAPVAAAEPPPAPRASAPLGGWSSTTQAPPSRPAAVAASPPPQARPAPPPRAEPPPASAPRAAPAAARLDGQHLVQLAAVRTEAEARALAAKAKGAAALAGREPAIDRAVLGNMGTFYRVRFGPFASAQEAQAACAKLQGGFDCMPVGP